MNKIEPLRTRRKGYRCRQNQERDFLLGQVCWKPEYWAGGDRRIEGMNLIRALVWNCGNQSFRCEGKSSSSLSYEAKSTEAEH